MVVYDLNCDSGHAFEGWFRNLEAFSDQLARGLVSCPVCHSVEVARRPTASRVNTGARPSAESPPKTAQSGVPVPVEHAGRMMAQAVRNFVEKHFEDVGQHFASEARRMHYGDAEERNIRGTATADEVRELHDEGIEARPLPDADTDKPN
jgi:hypothetical protein